MLPQLFQIGDYPRNQRIRQARHHKLDDPVLPHAVIRSEYLSYFRHDRRTSSDKKISNHRGNRPVCILHPCQESADVVIERRKSSQTRAFNRSQIVFR